MMMMMVHEEVLVVDVHGSHDETPQRTTGATCLFCFSPCVCILVDYINESSDGSRRDLLVTRSGIKVGETVLVAPIENEKRERVQM